MPPIAKRGPLGSNEVTLRGAVKRPSRLHRRIFGPTQQNFRTDRDDATCDGKTTIWINQSSRTSRIKGLPRCQVNSRGRENRSRLPPASRGKTSLWSQSPPVTTWLLETFHHFPSLDGYGPERPFFVIIGSHLHTITRSPSLSRTKMRLTIATTPLKLLSRH